MQTQMPTAISFRKYHGLGNDYVYVDAMSQPAVLAADLPTLARRISDRHFGIGADGLILLCHPTSGAAADVRMRMLNADGSEAQMCGNGIRCVAKFAHDHLGFRQQPMRVETGRGVLSILYTKVDGQLDSATVDMGAPLLAPHDVPTTLMATRNGQVVAASLLEIPNLTAMLRAAPAGGLILKATCVSMGNPHAVLLCAEPSDVDLGQIGPIVERASVFPERANISIMKVLTRSHISGRIWERGSGLTLASGTGASAMVVAGVLLGLVDRTVKVSQPGGDLSITWDERTNHVLKTGPATEVFSGVFML